MVTEKIIKTEDYKLNEVNNPNMSFMINDIMGFLKDIDPTASVARLHYLGKAKKEEFEEYINAHKSDNNVICVAAYASKVEFPPEKYYLYEIDKEKGKKLLPLKEILERESKVLEECGFNDINEYVQYETQVPFIYPNEIGLKVINAMRESVNKFNEKKDSN